MFTVARTRAERERPYPQVGQQEQEQDPTTDPPVHTAKHLFSSQKPKGSEPQQQWPKQYNANN